MRARAAGPTTGAYLLARHRARRGQGGARRCRAPVRPVAGVGIVTPSLVPPLVAALAAIWLGGHLVAAVAYVAGTFGTLVGADLLNMPRVRSLQAPMVSIGGAGTFDGVFLTGLVAVLLASL